MPSMTTGAWQRVHVPLVKPSPEATGSFPVTPRMEPPTASDASTFLPTPPSQFVAILAGARCPEKNSGVRRLLYVARRHTRVSTALSNVGRAPL